MARAGEGWEGSQDPPPEDPQGPQGAEGDGRKVKTHRHPLLSLKKSLAASWFTGPTALNEAEMHAGKCPLAPPRCCLPAHSAQQVAGSLFRTQKARGSQSAPGRQAENTEQPRVPGSLFTAYSVLKVHYLRKKELTQSCGQAEVDKEAAFQAVPSQSSQDEHCLRVLVALRHLTNTEVRTSGRETVCHCEGARASFARLCDLVPGPTTPAQGKAILVLMPESSPKALAAGRTAFRSWSTSTAPPRERAYPRERLPTGWLQRLGLEVGRVRIGGH